MKKCDCCENERDDSEFQETVFLNICIQCSKNKDLMELFLDDLKSAMIAHNTSSIDQQHYWRNAIADIKNLLEKMR